MSLTEKDIYDINKTNYIQNFIPSYTASQITVPYEYFDIGTDLELRKSVTEHFQNKILKWISKEWKSFKKHTKFIKSEKVFHLIY